MPRYFFHVLDGVSLRDDEGIELPNIYVVQRESVRLSGEILRDLGTHFWDAAEWRLEVADEEGQTLFVLRFSVEERVPRSEAASSPPTR